MPSKTSVGRKSWRRYYAGHTMMGAYDSGWEQNFGLIAILLLFLMVYNYLLHKNNKQKGPQVADARELRNKRSAFLERKHTSTPSTSSSLGRLRQAEQSLAPIQRPPTTKKTDDSPLQHKSTIAAKVAKPMARSDKTPPTAQGNQKSSFGIASATHPENDESTKNDESVASSKNKQDPQAPTCSSLQKKKKKFQLPPPSKYLPRVEAATLPSSSTPALNDTAASATSSATTTTTTTTFRRQLEIQQMLEQASSREERYNRILGFLTAARAARQVDQHFGDATVAADTVSQMMRQAQTPQERDQRIHGLLTAWGLAGSQQSTTPNSNDAPRTTPTASTATSTISSPLSSCTITETTNLSSPTRPTPGPQPSSSISPSSASAAAAKPSHHVMVQANCQAIAKRCVKFWSGKILFPNVTTLSFSSRSWQNARRTASAVT